jgi:phosphate transport system substrate-binding protein
MKKEKKGMGFKGFTKWFLLVSACLLAFSSILYSCSSPTGSTAGNTNSPTGGQSAVGNADLTGAGATFPAPLYTTWFDEYNKLTGIKINYGAVGSGTGITQITTRIVDFGASDGIMTDAQLQSAPGPILHIPMTTGAVAIIFNLEGITSGQLKLTGEVLANIYLKKIKNWNDAAITALNPDLNLPDKPIAVVHRSDGSGTTFIFTNYLSRVSDEWNSKVGNANSVTWPGDIGGAQSSGVAASVAQIPFSIGYVEMTYAIQNKLNWAALKNAAGNYQEPSIAGVSKSAEGLTLPDDMKIMITDSANPDAYPISGFTWILAYVDQKDKAKGQSLVNMLWWALHDGQKYEEPLGYAPLSSAALTKAENEILTITYQGQPIKTR